MPRFEYGEGVPWYPPMHDFNWRELWLERLAEQEAEELPPLYIVEDDYRQEITEANSTLYINSLCDPMDALYIVDARDFVPWRLFRGLINEFNSVCSMVAPYAAQTTTNAPLPFVEVDFRRLTLANAQAERNDPQIADQLVEKEMQQFDDELRSFLSNPDDTES